MAPWPAAGGLRSPGPPSTPTLPAPPLETGAAAGGRSEGSPSLPSPRASSHPQLSRPGGRGVSPGRARGGRTEVAKGTREEMPEEGPAPGSSPPGEAARRQLFLTQTRPYRPPQSAAPTRKPSPRPGPQPAGPGPDLPPLRALPGSNPLGPRTGLAPRPDRPLSPAAGTGTGPAPQAASPRPAPRARRPRRLAPLCLPLPGAHGRGGAGRRAPPRGCLGNVVPRLPPSTVGRWLSWGDPGQMTPRVGAQRPPGQWLCAPRARGGGPVPTQALR